MIRKYFNFILFSAFILLFFTFFSSCDDGPTEPNVEPGRRDYTWEVDTLNIPFTSLWRMWGSSPNDVWAIGPGGDLDKTIYHFNGLEWENDNVSRSISPTAIWGFDSNNVWIAGRGGTIWYYDGVEWSESFYLNENCNLLDLWGDNSNNIWAVGAIYNNTTPKIASLILHFDGINWNKYEIANNYQYTLLRIKRGLRTSNDYFIWALELNDASGNKTKLLKFDGYNLKEIYSSTYGANQWNYIQEINDEVIFLIDNGLYKYAKNDFSEIARNNNPQIIDGIIGRNTSDIFWSMRNGVSHFNGSNFEDVLSFEMNISLSDGLIFENQVFYLAKNQINSENYIFRGKLN